MKKFAATLFLVCSCLFAIAQNSNTLTFLGIPVDGSKRDMEAQLKQKGFKKKYGHGLLGGQFNGEDVAVSIHTNHQIVDRILVAFQPTTEHEIRIKYNRLLTQFKNNSKYSEIFCDNAEIPMDEDIEHEISVNHKRYEATFRYLNPDEDLSEEGIMERCYNAGLSSTWPEGKVADFITHIANFSNLSEKEQAELYELTLDLLQATKSVFDSITIGSVWFTIHRICKDAYYIGLYYDNLANRPNGEDL